MIPILRQPENRSQSQCRTDTPTWFNPLNPKVRWWSNDLWIKRFKRHIQPDACSEKGVTWRRIIDRRFTVQQFVHATANFRGSTAECGVYTGVTSAIICETLKDTYKGKELHLGFDSFEGLPAPGPNDGVWKEGHLSSPLEVASEHLAEFDFCKLIRGWIPESLEYVSDRSFRFVHIDLDLAEPTLKALEFFYPRVVCGGILLFDDYGFHSCPGARVAVDSFMAGNMESVVELVTGQAVIYKQ